MENVLLIAGHGKNANGTYDPGAVSAFGQEADYTRELVTMVGQSIGTAIRFDIYDMGKNCYSFSKAGQPPNYSNYGIVLEIHFNAKAKKDEAGNGSFTGIGAYVHPQNTGRDIANAIIKAVVSLGFKEWQINDSTGLLNLNRAQDAGCRYLLLETAFIDDGDDMTWYNANKTAVAQAIASVIITAAGGTQGAAKPSIPSTGTPGSPAYAPGLYKVIVEDLNIRQGPGTNYAITGSITDRGIYTILEFSGSWGRLKSGAGWINCSTTYCTRIGDADVDADAEPEDNLHPFEVRVTIQNLNIRQGPGTSYGKNGYCPPGVYNILEKREADGYTWGRLKSGAGWIALEYVEPV